MNSIGFPNRRPFFRPALAVLALSLLAWSAAGCGSDDSTGPGGDDEGSNLVGSWSVTSFLADGTDGIAGGMTMTITFTTSSPRTEPAARRGIQGTFSFAITNDTLGLCDDQGTSDCSDSNPFEVENGILYLERGTEDEVAFSYNVSGGTLAMSGDIDGIAIQITAARG